MKKTVSILLALILAAVSCCAFADSLDIQAGTPMAGTYDTLVTLFSAYGSTNLSVTWDGQAKEGVFEVYIGHVVGKEDIELKVFTTGGKVCFLTATGSKTVSFTDMAAARALGEDIGTVLGVGALAIYSLDGGQITKDLTTQFTTDLQNILTPLTDGLSNEKQLLEKGAASAALVLGYPTGLEISGTGSAGSATLDWRIVMGSKDTQLTVK